MGDDTTVGIGNDKMDNAEYVTAIWLSEICDRLQEVDCNGKWPTSLTKFVNWAGDHPNCFPDFKISYFPTTVCWKKKLICCWKKKKN